VIATDRAERLGRDRPEARVWLRLWQEAVREAADPAWRGVEARSAEASAPRAPRLAGCVVRVPVGPARRWLLRLFDAARGASGRSGRPVDGLDPLAFLAAAVRRDGPALVHAAGASGLEPPALRAVAELAVLPLLQACAGRLADGVPRGWREGHCPICGAWPTLAEARGVERTRRLRCGRCGGDWEGEWLRCAFCGNADHQRLGGLVPAQEGERRRVETCEGCGGYLKTIARLTPAPASEVLLEDLATVALDLAALAEGYRRPEGLGHPLRLTLVELPGLARRLLGRAG
jgi:FdhE protein